MIRSLRNFLGGDRSGDRRRRSRSGLLLSILMLPMLLGVMGCFDLPAPIGDPENSRIDPAINGIWLAESGDMEGLLMIFEPWDKRTWLVRWVTLEERSDWDEEVELDESETPGEAPEAEEDPAGTSDEGQVAETSDQGQDVEDREEIVEIVVPVDDRTPLQIIADGDMYAEGVALFKTWRTRISGDSFITMEFRVDIDTEQGMKPRVWWGARVWLTENDQLAVHFIDNDFDEVAAASTRRELERVVRRNHDNEDLYSGEEPVLLTRVPLEYYDAIGDIIEEAGLASEYD